MALVMRSRWFLLGSFGAFLIGLVFIFTGLTSKASGEDNEANVAHYLCYFEAEDGSIVDLSALCGNGSGSLEGNSSDYVFYQGEPVLDEDGQPMTHEEYRVMYNQFMDRADALHNEERLSKGLPPIEELPGYSLYLEVRHLCEDPSLCTSANVNKLRNFSYE
ncbi:hypothetical protein SPB21_20005 [Leptothoe sp. ISB3NOV94-8A]